MTMTSRSNQKKITKRVVDALQPGQVIWDTEVKGFGVRCQKLAKVYIVKTRVSGRQRWFSIGKHGSPWTPDTARREALTLLGSVAGGGGGALLKVREASKNISNVADLAEMFFPEHSLKIRPKTAEGYKLQLDKFILPVIGTLSIDSVDRADISKLHHSLSKTPYQANRVLALLSKMFNWAEMRGYRPDGTNPSRHVEKYPEKSRERFLSMEELARLADMLDEMEENNKITVYAATALRLLIFTGARMSEILTLKWAFVNLEASRLDLPESKTGKKTIYLSAPAKQLLAEIPRLTDNPYVIVGGKQGQHLVNLKDPWRAVRKRAGLDDVRIHDLRHTHASFAAAGGLSLPLIGKLLGHSQASTTQRYAHLADDPVRAASEKVGEKLAAAMRGVKGEVVPLKSGGK